MTFAKWLDVAVQDLGYAVRTLRKSPAFTGVVVLTLAFGIGINTAIFTVINAVLLRPLSYFDADRLVLIRETFPTLGLARISVSPPEYLEYRDRGRGPVFEEIAGFESANLTLAEGEEAERLSAARVSASLFPLLRPRLLLGQPFTVGAENPGSDRVVLLSHALWRRRFGADPGLVGRTVRFDGTPYRVLGVLAPEFQFPHPGTLDVEPADALIPLAYGPEERTGAASTLNTHVLARLAPGATLGQAQDLAASILRRFRERFPSGNVVPATAEVVPLRVEVVGKVRGPLVLLMGAVGFVLLIAAANVAYLTLVRVGNRRAELAMRTALGADSSRLVRQLLTETLVTGIVGGLGGLVVAWVGVRLLVALRPGDVPRLAESHLDPMVFGFALVVSLVTGAVVGIVPAWIAARTPPGDALKVGRRAVGGRWGARVGMLVVAEVALAIVLLVGAGLVIRSFVKVQQVATGLAAEGTLFARAYPTASTYVTGGQVLAFYASLLDRIRHLPGVEAAAITSTAIVRDGWNAGYVTEDDLNAGRPALSSARDALVSPDYFKALGVPIRRGRPFTEQDRADQPRVIIVNETMARLRWPHVDPIGRRMAWGDPTRGAPWWTVVGVVADVKETGLDVPTPPAMYIPYAQATPDTATRVIRSMVLVVRGRGDAAGLIDPVRGAVAAADPTVPIDGIRTVRQIYADSLAPRRFTTLLLSAFGIAALGLAALGLYGVMTEAVAQRVPEIGLRMALGARPATVLSMVIRQAAVFTGTGVLAGAALAVPLTALVSRFLFGVGRMDPVTLVGVALVLATVGFLAVLVPARRAARIDPMTALREE